MPLFGRGRASRPDAGLLTGVISREGDSWRVFFVGDGKNEPAEFVAAGLTAATDQAATQALALYLRRPPAPAAELQFAIYPWDYGKDGGIYDIGGGPGQFSARDLQGSDQQVTAATLEDLVEALRQQPGGDIAMLRWNRSFDELTAAEAGE
jgi:hypothetical protein